ncbi:hypothetical protein, partial [Pseudomonas aeruginosa]|uniref:hypothetical protein n=2 Tax=Pseudomonas aeruginosa TaxID=287 RepID=UPI001C20079B
PAATDRPGKGTYPNGEGGPRWWRAAWPVPHAAWLYWRRGNKTPSMKSVPDPNVALPVISATYLSFFCRETAFG